MPDPPILKVYKDGSAMFQRGEKYFTAKIDARKLDELMGKLARTSFLQRYRSNPPPGDEFISFPLLV